MNAIPRAALFALIFAITAACTQTVKWSHPGVSDEQFVQHVRECEGQAQAVLARDRKIDSDVRAAREPITIDRLDETQFEAQMSETGYKTSFEKLVARCLEGRGFKRRRTRFYGLFD